MKCYGDVYLLRLSKIFKIRMAVSLLIAYIAIVFMWRYFVRVHAGFPVSNDVVWVAGKGSGLLIG